MKRPWYSSDSGLVGLPTTSTSSITPSARVTVTSIVSMDSGVWYEPSAV